MSETERDGAPDGAGRPEVSLRAGLLGAGGIARRHVAVMPECGVELAAVTSRDLAGAQAFSDEMTAGAATAYPSLGAMLADAGLDLLVVALPPGAHGDEVAAAASSGVHLLLEKPIALTSAAAWEMVEQVERAGVRSQVGFMYRFGALVERLHTLAGDGLLGRMGMYDGRFYCNALHAPWWRDATVSGGQLLEQVIHHVDLLRYLVGDPTRVSATASNIFHTSVEGYTIEDVGAAVTTGAKGEVGALRWSNAAIPGRWDKAFSVIAANATVHATDHNTGTLTWTDGEQAGASIDLSGPDRAFAAQLSDLVTAIRTGGTTRTPIREGARSLDLALAIAESAARGGELVHVLPGE